MRTVDIRIDIERTGTYVTMRITHLPTGVYVGAGGHREDSMREFLLTRLEQTLANQSPNPAAGGEAAVAAGQLPRQEVA